MSNKINYNLIEENMLLRSGFRESEASPRYLVYHIAKKSDVERLLKRELANKKLLNKDVNIMNDLSQQANYLDMYMTLYLKDGENKKYIHIEKDDTVTLTNKPTCFFDVELFEDNNLIEYEKMITNVYKKSDTYKRYGSFKLEKISNKLFNTIKSKPADMNY